MILHCVISVREMKVERRGWSGINVLSQRLEHKPVCFMRWPQDVWLWRLISSGLSAPVLILSSHTFPTHTHTVSAPRRFTDCSHGIRSLCSQVIVCVPHYVCVLPASHTEIMCISSYSQANPPPIIVNADSLDAGPYVSICSLSLYSIHLSHSHSLCVGAWARLCVCARVCADEKAASWLQHAVCHVGRHPLSYWPCLFVGKCAFCSRTCSVTVHMHFLRKKDTFDCNESEIHASIFSQ